MSARIAPSSISLIGPAIVAVTHSVSALDSTGDPGTNPSGSGTNPIIFTPPGGTGGSGNC
jgi:hypothetical protein